MTAAQLRLVRFALAAVWLVTGFVSLVVYPRQDSLALLEKVGLLGIAAEAALYGGAWFDIVFGVLTLFARGKWLWATQGLLTLAYMLIITLRLPEFWAHPFGPILKNLPMLVLMRLLYENEGRAS